MGQEITDSRFSEADFIEFRRRLDVETELLQSWLDRGLLHSARRRLGFEIEGWLIDTAGQPAPRNEAFLQAVDDPLVVPELARFNFEVNSEPLPLEPGTLDAMHAALLERWGRCTAAAAGLQLRPLLIGILPTVRSEHLTLDNMSPLQRYRAINDQIFRLRNGRPIELDIHGVEHLTHRHQDVMLESGTTSLQIHVEVGAGEAARALNVCKMISAITVAAGANSPYLFGRQLWQETRIPLFEQAVAVGGTDYSKRVTFGVRYADRSIFECFEANRARYPVILPDLMETPVESLAHLRLHNGTVWRWNRPLIGFDDQGRPHCRVEHRVVAAGPTPCDAIANTALFLGLFEALMRDARPLETLLPFAVARDNFYAAAKFGLAASVRWLDGRSHVLGDLLLAALCDLAVDGLCAAGIDPAEAKRWLAVIRERARRRRNGAAWQVAWVTANDAEPADLVNAYAAGQAEDMPVHLWNLGETVSE